jgi:hypothetical protein
MAPSTLFALPDAATLGAFPAPPDADPQARKSGLTPDQEQEVEARLANIVRKYGDRLTESQRTHLRRILAYNEKLLTSIRKHPLENGDPPASVLKLATGKNSESAASASPSGMKGGAS